jgi:hypothetical protein
MRVAILIIGLVFAILSGLQAFTAYMFGSGFGQHGTSNAGSMGMVVALFLLLGAAFALNIPTVSVVMFTIGGIFGVSTPAGSYGDLTAWGVISFILAVMALVAVLIKRHAKKKAQALETPQV